MTIRSHYKTGRVSGHRTSGASQTVRSDMQGTSISAVLQRYAHLPVRAEVDPDAFVDVSRFGDFGDVLDRVTEGRRLFMSLPSQVRKVYDHDPLSFFNDITAHPERLQELGIVKSKGNPIQKATISRSEASRGPSEQNSSTEPTEAQS